MQELQGFINSQTPLGHFIHPLRELGSRFARTSSLHSKLLFFFRAILFSAHTLFLCIFVPYFFVCIKEFFFISMIALAKIVSAFQFFNVHEKHHVDNSIHMLLPLGFVELCVVSS